MEMVDRIPLRTKPVRHSHALWRFLVVCATLVGLTLGAEAVEPEAHGAREGRTAQRASAQRTLEGEGENEEEDEQAIVPHLAWTLPFLAMLLSIALLPVIPLTQHWWERNRHRLAVAMALSAVTCGYYLFRDFGYHYAPPGIASLALVLKHALLEDYLPFITLLFSLYVISGGIAFRGDIAATPATNTAVLAVGALAASLIGTTGVAMLMIRPLLRINRERKYVRHTVIFFIFLVCNIGGCLLPVGDPPLFLGYLRGVPFWWTLTLAPQWAVSVALVLAIYFVWDSVIYRREPPEARALDNATREPFAMEGRINLWFLGGVVLSVAFLVPNRHFLGLPWMLPNLYLREIVMVSLALASIRMTSRRIRAANDFNYLAITEVGCLFVGIFITMQVPIEILSDMGPNLGLSMPWHFFWVTGSLSSFLDNAPTYVVFFELARTIPVEAGVSMIGLTRGLHGMPSEIPAALLAATSCGAVFMGALTYLGNGPNFMVRSIARHAGIKMPSFFGYMLYSVAILVPVFLVVTWMFF